MMKIISVFMLAIMILPLISAINIDVKEISSDEVMIYGINKPATFNLEITNWGEEDNLRFDNFLGFSMFPIGTIPIKKGETKDIRLIIYPREDLEQRGFYNFQYVITSKDLTSISKDVSVNIIELKDVFEIGSGEIDPSSNSLQIYLKNKESFDFENINVKFASAFFELEESFPLGANERKNFSVQLNKGDFSKLMAGFYTLNAEIIIEDEKTELEGVIKFIEKDILTTTSSNLGFVLQTEIIKKTNEGNVIAKSETIIEKNILSRLFTSFSPEPDFAERNGAIVYYSWSRKINPGESMDITVKTNWLFPFLIILFVIVIVILAKQYSKTDLVMRKKVSFVKAKGGEFALKVSIVVQAKKYIERINVVDKLPPLVKIYERFGGEQPTKIDEKNKRVEWDFEKLEAGEMRILSYVIYSKIGILGRFILPEATAIYEKEGKVEETTSNRAFFVAEQRKKDIEE